MANWDTMIRPYPAYWMLLDRAGKDVSPVTLRTPSAISRPMTFSTAGMRST